MHTNPPNLTRRRLLAGLGASGFLLVGAGTTAGVFDRPHPYTRFTYAATGEDSRVRVGWYETYNGDVIGTQNGTSETNTTAVLDSSTNPEYVREAAPNGPSIALLEIMPGDYGTIAVGLFAETLPPDDDGIEFWMRMALTENAENGVTEPESKDPDEDDLYGLTSGSETSGELGDAIAIEVWEDTGTTLGGVGACDGQLGLDETAFYPNGQSLRDTATGLKGGRKLGTSVGETCFAEGDTLCLGLDWWIPDSVRDGIQTDSIGFDIQFIGQSCGAGNPFGGS